MKIDWHVRNYSKNMMIKSYQRLPTPLITMTNYDKSIMYELDAEGEVVYKEIAEKYNDQFNLKWSGMLKIMVLIIL